MLLSLLGLFVGCAAAGVGYLGGLSLGTMWRSMGKDSAVAAAWANAVFTWLAFMGTIAIAVGAGLVRKWDRVSKAKLYAAKVSLELEDILPTINSAVRELESVLAKPMSPDVFPDLIRVRVNLSQIALWDIDVVESIVPLNRSLGLPLFKAANKMKAVKNVLSEVDEEQHPFHANLAAKAALKIVRDAQDCLLEIDKRLQRYALKD